jgi:hypothetical protein
VELEELLSKPVVSLPSFDPEVVFRRPTNAPEHGPTGLPRIQPETPGGKNSALTTYQEDTHRGS